MVLLSDGEAHKEIDRLSVELVAAGVMTRDEICTLCDGLGPVGLNKLIGDLRTMGGTKPAAHTPAPTPTPRPAASGTTGILDRYVNATGTERQKLWRDHSAEIIAEKVARENEAPAPDTDGESLLAQYESLRGPAKSKFLKSHAEQLRIAERKQRAGK